MASDGNCIDILNQNLAQGSVQAISEDSLLTMWQKENERW